MVMEKRGVLLMITLFLAVSAAYSKGTAIQQFDKCLEQCSTFRCKGRCAQEYYIQRQDEDASNAWRPDCEKACAIAAASPFVPYDECVRGCHEKWDNKE